MKRAFRILCAFAPLFAAYVLAIAPLRAGESGMFASLKDAALAGLDCARSFPDAKRFEFGGVIYRQYGVYYFTPPETSRDPQMLRFEATFPAGAQLVGIYHTHPKAPDSARFSPPDVAMAVQLDVPSFIAVLPGHEVRVFDPHVDVRVRDFGRIGYGAIARGRIVRASNGETHGLADGPSKRH